MDCEGAVCWGYGTGADIDCCRAVLERDNRNKLLKQPRDNTKRIIPPINMIGFRFLPGGMMPASVNSIPHSGHLVTDPTDLLTS